MVPFPGPPIDSRTMHIQQKVEQLFDSGEYRRARFIYENELAPLGDKYAQYMIGYIHLTGAGVQEDPALAAAWYRLAAERGNSQFVAIRDQLLDGMTEFDRGRTDALFLDLRRKFSDAAIVLDLIKDDLASMTMRTGSRISTATGPVTIVDPRSGRSLSADDFERQVSRRIEARALFLVRKLDIRNFDINISRLDIDALEDQVKKYLSELPE
ncbi:MAG: SEL1-like repeat protein [Woeseiaceae bacterium]|nr:SEL1-like repeat protein [Woeseiaceae bacterium]